MTESIRLKASSRPAWYFPLGSLICGVILLASLCAPSAHGQSAPAATVSGLPTVDSLIATEFAKDSLGSITVGIISGSQLAWTHSYGFADIKSHRLATRTTVYRIGSITKPFTAVMLMQLEAAGKLTLSDPVENISPKSNRSAPNPRAHRRSPSSNSRR